jgi:hypothetical protein
MRATCHAHLSNSTLFHNPSNILWIVQITLPFIMEFPPPSCFSLSTFFTAPCSPERWNYSLGLITWNLKGVYSMRLAWDGFLSDAIHSNSNLPSPPASFALLSSLPCKFQVIRPTLHDRVWLTTHTKQRAKLTHLLILNFMFLEALAKLSVRTQQLGSN